MANTHRYGIRFVKNRWGGDVPEVETRYIASAYAPNTGAEGSGGTACNLHPGDPVQLLENGTVRLAQVGVGTTSIDEDDRVYGVVAGFPRVKINGAVRPNGHYPSGTTYTGGVGSPESTQVTIIPCAGSVFEIDANAVLGTPTRAFAESLVSHTAHFAYPTTTVATGVKADPQLNLSTQGSTNDCQLRIIGLGSNADQQDYTATNVTFRVVFNAVQESPFYTEGSVED